MALAEIRGTLTSRLRRDVALRGGLISAAATLAVLLLLTTLTWLFLVDRLQARIEESLTTRHQVSLSNNITFNDEELSLFRKFRQQLPVRDEGVFAWINADGVTFSSNIDSLDCREGFYDRWVDITPSSLESPVAQLSNDRTDSLHLDRFRFLAHKREENCLVFGRSMYEVDELHGSISSKK